MATTTRFDHSNCGHAKSGSEGKKARAKCRKAHAEAAAKELADKKASTTAKRTATRKASTPRKPKVTVPAAPEPAEDDLVADL